MATRMKSFDELMDQRMAKTAKREGKTVEELKAEHGDPMSDKMSFEESSEGGLPEPQTPSPPDPTEDSSPQQSSELDDLRREIDSLQNQLAAAKGRVIPEQQRNAAMEATLSTIQQQHKTQVAEMQSLIDSLQNQLEQKKIAEFKVEDLLTEDEKDLIDPSQLAIFSKVAAAAAQRFAPKVDVEATVKAQMENEKKRQVDEYRDRQLSGKHPVGQLLDLSNNTKFRSWMDTNADVKYMIDAFLAARSTREIDDVVKVLNKRIDDYYSQSNGRRQQTTTDPVITGGSLEQHMQREPIAKDGRQQQADMERMSRRLKDLMRSHRGRYSQEARDLLDKLNSLQ